MLLKGTPDLKDSVTAVANYVDLSAKIQKYTIVFLKKVILHLANVHISYMTVHKYLLPSL